MTDGLQKAPEITLQQCNRIHNEEASLSIAKKSETAHFTLGDYVLEWRPRSSEGLITELFGKWIGPLEIIEQISSVSYRAEKPVGKKNFHWSYTWRDSKSTMSGRIEFASFKNRAKRRLNISKRGWRPLSNNFGKGALQNPPWSRNTSAMNSARGIIRNQNKRTRLFLSAENAQKNLRTI